MNEPLQLGRYSLLTQLASGGMATVYLGRLNGEVGFGRTVAIKRLHPHLAAEPQFVSMFLDEARLAARIQHPNVVPTLDVVTLGRELFIVMEYVRGESLVALLKATSAAGVSIPIPVVAAITIGLLNGLHAAHEATDERGERLWIVHRDVSPQNVLVGADGVARVLDFGIAKAAMRLQNTREGQLKGKLAYMAPEQVFGEVSHRTDIYSAGIVLWEMLACRRLYSGDTEGQLLRKVMDVEVKPPSRHNQDVPPELDRVVLKALAKDPADRYPTAHAMSEDLDRALRPASTMAVAEWVQSLGRTGLAARSKLVADLENRESSGGAILTNLPGNGADELQTATIANDTLGSLPSETQTPSRVGSLTREASTELAGRGWLVLAAAAAVFVPAVLGGAFLVAQHGNGRPEVSTTAPPPVTGLAEPARPEPSSTSPVVTPPPAEEPSTAMPVQPPAPSSVAIAPGRGTTTSPVRKLPPKPATHPPPASSLDVFSGPRK